MRETSHLFPVEPNLNIGNGREKKHAVNLYAQLNLSLMLVRGGPPPIPPVVKLAPLPPVSTAGPFCSRHSMPPPFFYSLRTAPHPRYTPSLSKNRHGTTSPLSPGVTAVPSSTLSSDPVGDGSALCLCRWFGSTREGMEVVSNIETACSFL